MARINWKEEFATILDIEAMSARDRNVVEDIKKGYDRQGSSYLSPGRKSYLAGIKERSLQQQVAREERATLGETVMAQRLTSLPPFVGRARGSQPHASPLPHRWFPTRPGVKGR